MTEGLDSRRTVLRRAAIGAGALAASGLARPVLAIAQSADDDDLRDYLVQATGLEQLGVLAYATAADARGTEPTVKKTLLAFRDQEQAHANAWRSALDSLGFDSPDPPESATDTGVFDNVDGLSEDASKELTDLLNRLAKLNKPEELLDYLAALERRELAYYLDGAPALDSEDLATTSGEVAGCQAEHLVVLRQALGDAPAEAVKTVEDAAAPAGGGGSSASSG